MAKYQKYAEYQDSGIEWLGEIPNSWQVKKLKYLCKVTTGNKDTVNAVEDGKYPFFVRSQTVERINSIGADCEAVLTAGDGVGVGKVYHYYKGKFDFHQRVYMLYDFGDVIGRFVYYYLSSNFYKVALEGNAKSTVDSLRLPQFLNFAFSLPTIKEQDWIVDFLDHETAKIDTLIAKQEKLIELLKEKRQAVISHAVTKGLNPNVPMKDSG
uniref:restriction endonuclease subunit S n=2 Tax=Moraxellaceae TaxID=468 RepID=UPI0022B5CD74